MPPYIIQKKKKKRSIVQGNHWHDGKVRDHFQPSRTTDFGHYLQAAFRNLHVDAVHIAFPENTSLFHNANEKVLDGVCWCLNFGLCNVVVVCCNYNAKGLSETNRRATIGSIDMYSLLSIHCFHTSEWGISYRIISCK